MAFCMCPTDQHGRLEASPPRRCPRPRRRSWSHWSRTGRNFSILTGLTATRPGPTGTGWGPRPGARLPHRCPAPQDGRHRYPRRFPGPRWLPPGLGKHLARIFEIGTEVGSWPKLRFRYSCVYSSTMARRSATQPLPKEVNPKLVLERLFDPAREERERRDARRKR